MALSQLQVNVLRTVAIDDAVPVSVLVGYQQEETGARRPVARAALSRSLRRLWRLGAVELHGRRTSLTLGQSTAFLMACQGRAARRLVWWHLANSLQPSRDPIPSSVYVRSVTLTVVGRDILQAAEGGGFPVWR